MKKYVDGQYIEMTEGEEAALVPTETALPSQEQRIEALEAAMLEMIMRGGTND